MGKPKKTTASKSNAPNVTLTRTEIISLFFPSKTGNSHVYIKAGTRDVFIISSDTMESVINHEIKMIEFAPAKEGNPALTIYKPIK